MSGFGQYIKDTRAELRHVAWPTQNQTIVYTLLVALISVGVAAYLGLFDFLFTTGLTRVLSAMQSGVTVTQQPVTNTTDTSNTLVQGSPIQIVASTTNTH